MVKKDENNSVKEEDLSGGEDNTNVKHKKVAEFSAPNILIAVVAVLVIMSGIQVFQSQKLLGAVSSGAIKASAQTQGSPVGLPSQVGGCG